MFPCVSLGTHAHITVLLVMCSTLSIVLTRPTDAWRRNAIMMMKLACDEFFRIVVNVGWEEFTQDFSAHDIGECSQVKGETRRYVNTSKPTLTAFENIIRTNVGDVEVGEFVSLKFGVSHSSICASAESFTTNINDLRTI